MRKSDLQIKKSGPQGAAEELNQVNAGTLQQGADRVRRKIEASIEAKAKKRRKREAPSSSAWNKF